MTTGNFYYGYKLVAAAFLAQFIAIGIYSYVLGPFMQPMIDDLGWTRAEFTLTRSISQIVMAVTGVFVGVQVDRFGGRSIMLIGATILTAVLIAHSQINSLFSWWLLNGVLLTVGTAMVGSLVVNVTLSKWFIVNRGKAIAYAAMGVSFGGIVLTPLATFLIDNTGWRTAWICLGLFSAAILYPVALMMRRAPEDEGLNPDGFSKEQMQAHPQTANTNGGEFAFTRAEALRTLSFYALVIAFGFFTINIVVLLLLSVPFLTDSGFSRGDAALAIFVASIPAMLSKPIWGYLIDRGRPKPLAAGSAMVTGLALVLIIFSVDAGVFFWVSLAYMVLGFGWGGMIPLQEVIWASYFGRRHIGAIRGAGMPFGLLLGAAAPWLVALSADLTGTYSDALMVVALLNILSGILIFLIPPPRARDQSNQHK